MKKKPVRTPTVDLPLSPQTQREQTGLAKRPPAPAAAVLRPTDVSLGDAEFEAALEELATIGAGIAAQDDLLTHAREDIYFDHD